MKKLNIAFSFILIALAGVFYFYADTFKTMPGQKDIGPAAFPKAIAILIVIAAVVLLITELRKKESEKADLLNLKVVIGVVTAVVFVALFKKIGFIVGAMISVFIMELMLLNEPFKKAWPLVTGVAVIAPIVLYVIFGVLLKVPLPMGVLAPIFGK